MSEHCKDCIHCQELKHNFEVGKGYDESLACDVLHDLIVEVSENDMCEMFTPKLKEQEHEHTD